MIFCVGRLQYHHTVLCVKSFLHGVQRLFCQSLLHADAGKHAEALRLDVDLTFLTLFGADFVAVCVVSPHEPVTVPAVLEDSVVHDSDLVPRALCLGIIAEQLRELCVLLAVLDEHSGDKYRLCDRTLARSEGLEGFARVLGEAVEVQAVIPVGTPDERQLVRSLVVHDIVKRALQVLHQ